MRPTNSVTFWLPGMLSSLHGCEMESCSGAASSSAHLQLLQPKQAVFLRASITIPDALPSSPNIDVKKCYTTSRH